jgi:hypothetical protein
MCPHRHHPSPHFQAAMQPEGYVWQGGPQGTWRQMAVYTGVRVQMLGNEWGTTSRVALKGTGDRCAPICGAADGWVHTMSQ